MSLNKSQPIKNQRGFTLVELLVVIVILAIIGVVGVTLFNSTTKSAQDAKKKADINAISKAYEANYIPLAGYTPLDPSQFADGKIPVPEEGGSYFNDLLPNGGFRVCTAVNGGTDPCSANSETCFCKDSTQVTYVASLLPSPSPSPEPSEEPPLPSPSPSPLPSPSPSSPPSNPLAHPESCDPGQTLDVGLAGYWKFNESSGTSATDEIGSSPGTVVNGTFGSGYPNSTTMAFGNAIYLQAGSAPLNYVDLGNTAALNIMGPITLSAWVSPTLTSGTTILFARTQGNVTTGQFEMYKSSSSAAFRIGNGTIFSTATVSSVFPTANVWTHVVGVFDGTQLRVYRNAVSGTAVTFTGPQINYNNNVKLGIRSTNGAPGASGEIRMDDVRIYNRALSSTEVASLYNGGEGCLPN